MAWSAVEAAAVVAHLQKTELHQKRAQTPSPICVEGAQVMTAAQKRSSSTSCHMSPTRMLALSLNCYKLTPATTTTETETVGNSCKTTKMLYRKNVFSTIFGTFCDDMEGLGRNIFLVRIPALWIPVDTEVLSRTMYVQRKYNIPATRYLTLTSTYQFPIYRTRNLGDPPGPNLYLVLGSMPSSFYSHTVFVR